MFLKMLKKKKKNCVGFSSSICCLKYHGTYMQCVRDEAVGIFGKMKVKFWKECCKCWNCEVVNWNCHLLTRIVHLLTKLWTCYQELYSC